MNETTVTVIGTVCSEVRYGQGSDTTPIARFQIRNTPRRFDKRTNTWTDGDPNYFSAVCWRNLADHVASSMGVGDPVVATGRLRINRWRRGEENVVTAEIEVQAIGHDLRWGTTVYRKATPPGGTRIPGPTRRREEAATAAGIPPTATATEPEPAGIGSGVAALATAGTSNGLGPAAPAKTGAGAEAAARTGAGAEAAARTGAGAGLGAVARTGTGTATTATADSPTPANPAPTSPDTTARDQAPASPEVVNLPTAA